MLYLYDGFSCADWLLVCLLVFVSFSLVAYNVRLEKARQKLKESMVWVLLCINATFATDFMYTIAVYARCTIRLEYNVIDHLILVLDGIIHSNARSSKQAKGKKIDQAEKLKQEGNV